MPGMLVWYLGVFKALALNVMALALYFMTMFKERDMAWNITYSYFKATTP